MQVITSTDALGSLCDVLSTAPYITVDTEFMRDKTFWSKLCLIQVASPEQEAIIDPLAKGIDLAPFFELLVNPKVVKVFHASRQDIEIFYHMGGIIPAPLFDTQIAAMACGFSDSVGYDALVKQLTRQHIDKSSRFSDWSRRPLTEKQLSYALADVTHLRPVYEALKKTLDEKGRAHWLDDELAALTDPATYDLHPENAWRRLKLRGPVRRRLGVLIEVATWRDTQAQKRDLPRSRILKDDQLYEIVAQHPESLEAMKKMRFGAKGVANMPDAQGLIEAIKRGLAIPKADLPEIAPPTPPTTNGNGSLIEILKVILKLTSEQEGVASKLIASVADLEKIALSDKADVPALTGWRREIFGEVALRLKNGELALAYKNDQLTLVPLK